jgi:hypothetical protein
MEKYTYLYKYIFMCVYMNIYLSIVPVMGLDVYTVYSMEGKLKNPFLLVFGDGSREAC